MLNKTHFISILGLCALFGQRTPVSATTADSLLRIVNTDVSLTKEKVTQLIFPERIEKWRGGFNTETFVKEVYNNILYLQPLTSFPASNLHVITADGANYTINIRYTDSIPQATYLYSSHDAIIPPKTLTLDGGKTQLETNVATVSPTLPSVVNRPECPTPKQMVGKVLAEKDFIVNRSGVRYKNLRFQIAGIYYHDDQLYFKCKVSNSTNIPYEFDYIGFSLQTRKRRKTTTANTEEIIPLDAYYEATAVTSDKEISCVFVLKKFTVGNDNTLVVSIVEKDGGRNMILNITDDILLQARNI